MNILEHVISVLSSKAQNQAYRPFDEEMCNLVGGLFAEVDILKRQVEKLRNKVTRMENKDGY